MQVSQLPDWSPMMDILLVQQKGRGDRPGIFTTSGRQPYGAITELRKGLEARITVEAKLSEDKSLVGASVMWALPDPFNRGTHFVFSYPSMTTCVFLSADWHDTLEPEIPVDSARSTILAALTPDNNVLLVTDNVISVSNLETNHEANKSFSSLHLPTDTAITAADYCGEFNRLVLGTRTNEKFTLVLYQVISDSTSVIQLSSFDPQGELTCLSLFVVDSQLYTVAAFLDGAVSLLAVKDADTGSQGSFHLRHQISLRDIASFEASHVAQSVVVVHRWSIALNQSEYLVLCGMRDGNIATIHLGGANEGQGVQINSLGMSATLSQCSSLTKVEINQKSPIRLGYSPVQLSTSSDCSHRAFAVCGVDTCLLEFEPERSHAEVRRSVLIITSIWLTDIENTAYNQPSLSSLCILPSKDDNASEIACIDGESLRIATLNNEHRVVARRIKLEKLVDNQELDTDIGRKIDISGSPTKVIYSDKLNAFIIAGIRYDHMPQPRPPQSAWQGKRAARSFVQVMPMMGNHAASANGEVVWNEKSIYINLAPTERVLSMCEWRFRRTEGVYHFLLIGTRYLTKDGRREGRVWFLVPRLDKDGSLIVELLFIKKFSAPVRALCVYDESRIAMSLNNGFGLYEYVHKK